MMWNGLPVIRREIAECMINDFGLSQKEAAEKLGVTPAAICQYLSRKRGKQNNINKIMYTEITVSAERIIKHNGSSLIEETCRICKVMKKKGVHPFFKLADEE